MLAEHAAHALTVVTVAALGELPRAVPLGPSPIQDMGNVWRVIVTLPVDTHRAPAKGFGQFFRYLRYWESSNATTAPSPLTTNRPDHRHFQLSP